jgi:hypothetical protein
MTEDFFTNLVDFDVIDTPKLVEITIWGLDHVWIQEINTMFH